MRIEVRLVAHQFAAAGVLHECHILSFVTRQSRATAVFSYWKIQFHSSRIQTVFTFARFCNPGVRFISRVTCCAQTQNFVFAPRRRPKRIVRGAFFNFSVGSVVVLSAERVVDLWIDLGKRELCRPGLDLKRRTSLGRFL